jgi:hypothetical protein
MCSVSPERSLTCSNSGKAYLVLLSIIAIVVLASASVVEEGSERTRPVIRRSNDVAKKVYGLANKAAKGGRSKSLAVRSKTSLVVLASDISLSSSFASS